MKSQRGSSALLAPTSRRPWLGGNSEAWDGGGDESVGEGVVDQQQCVGGVGHMCAGRLYLVYL